MAVSYNMGVIDKRGFSTVSSYALAKQIERQGYLINGGRDVAHRV